jgi:chromosome segregation ATPase
MGFPHPVPGGHHFMQGPPPGLPPGFDEPDKHELDDGAIDPSLDPSLSHTNPNDEGPSKVIARLSEELYEIKRQYTINTLESDKLTEQLAKAREEIELLEAKLEEEVSNRTEAERKQQEAERRRIFCEQRLKEIGVDLDEEEERAIRIEIEADADGDPEVAEDPVVG